MEEYSTFEVGDATTLYLLNAHGSNGTAGDSMEISNGSPFSTLDADHDTRGDNCAVTYHGGWWHSSCHWNLLNGPYLSTPTITYGRGIVWHTWNGLGTPLKTTIISVL